MKSSRIKRLYPKKLAEQLAAARGTSREELLARADREASGTIDKMESKGFRLAARLETGEGVFVRDEEVVALHVQLPQRLYERLAKESARRETSKRQIVIEALEKLLD
jgi:hypothetical protein